MCSLSLSLSLSFTLALLLSRSLPLSLSPSLALSLSPSLPLSLSLSLTRARALSHALSSQVDLPPEGLQRADGSPWSRSDVDTLGTIRILRDPSIWHEVTAAEEPDAKKRKAAQAALDDKEEEAFVAAALLEKGASNIQPGGAIPACSRYGPRRPRRW